MNQERSQLDYPLLTGVLLLCGVGLIVLFSAVGENMELIIKHAIRAGVALVLMIVVSRLPPKLLARWSPHIYLCGLALLIVVLAVGFIGKGAQRWIDLGLFRFQPAEIMKIGVPMMVAWLLTRMSLSLRLAPLIISILIIAAPVVLIMQQPDLGTALLIALAGLTVIFLAGVSFRWILLVSALGALIAPMMWYWVLFDYQRNRILTLLDPWADPLGAGYHTIQSIIAIGSGGFWGKGWLSGTQSQLEFIPERNTDFVFSVFAEEFGLVGVAVLMFLYCFVVFRGLLIAYRAKDTYSRLLAGGLSATFFFYVFVNIGMVSGILPIVGVPLPLISYGGTSMVTLMIGFGILMSISRDKGSLRY